MLANETKISKFSIRTHHSARKGNNQLDSNQETKCAMQDNSFYICLNDAYGNLTAVDDAKPTMIQEQVEQQQNEYTATYQASMIWH